MSESRRTLLYIYFVETSTDREWSLLLYMSTNGRETYCIVHDRRKKVARERSCLCLNGQCPFWMCMSKGSFLSFSFDLDSLGRRGICRGSHLSSDLSNTRIF